ncbi:MAG TPA: LysM peptidoglycan-binding domain-containing protein, partial [Sulfurovum sp.]|nr:LysM peptidoglycan-binding domain-containing protein [Sulfurovum sp.]
NSQREKSKKIVLKKVKALDNVRTIVVKKDDTLYTLAEKAYGNASYYRLIFDANPKVLKTEKDLYIGQTLRIPF